MTEDEKKKIHRTKLAYKNTRHFLHCKDCIDKFLASDLSKVMTQKDYSIYEVGTMDFKYPDGKTEKIMVVWCKRCKNRIWDSRNYKKFM